MKLIICVLVFITTATAPAAVTGPHNLDQKTFCEDQFTIGPRGETIHDRRARQTHKQLLEGLQVIRSGVEVEVVTGLRPVATAEFFSSVIFRGNDDEIFWSDRTILERDVPLRFRFRRAPTSTGLNDWEPEIEIYQEADSDHAQTILGLVIGKPSPIFHWGETKGQQSEVGFVSPSQLSGSERRYVSVTRLKNDDIVVTLGIDVVCTKLHLFRQDRNFTNEILNKKRLCRIPVLRGVF